jgi:hypothetical protein
MFGMPKTSTSSSLVLSKGIKIQRSQVRAHIVFAIVFRYTLDLCGRRRADRTRARSRRRALGRRRTLHVRAARARAGRAFTTLFLAGTVVDNHRLGSRNAALQDILTEVRRRRAFSLQHILTQIRALRAGRNRALQDILAQIRLATRRADWARIRSTSAGTRSSTSLATGNRHRARFKPFFLHRLLSRFFNIAT